MPITLPGYNLGDKGKPEHFNASTTREQAAIEAKILDLGDAAFIKRSDLSWTYAVITERVEDKNGVVLRFEVDKDKNRKSFPQAQWGKYIRVIKNVETSEEPTVDEQLPPAPADTAHVEEKNDETVEEKKEDTPAAEEVKEEESPKVEQQKKEESPELKEKKDESPEVDEKKEKSPEVEEKKEEPSKVEEKKENASAVQEIKVEEKKEKKPPAVDGKKEKTPTTTPPAEDQGFEIEAPNSIMADDSKGKKSYSSWFGNIFGSSISKKKETTAGMPAPEAPSKTSPNVPNSKEAVDANIPKPDEPVVADAPVVANTPKPSNSVVADSPKPPKPAVADSTKSPKPAVTNSPKSSEPVVVEAPKPPKPVAAETKTQDPIVKETKPSEPAIEKEKETVTPTLLPAVDEVNESKENSIPAPSNVSRTSDDKSKITSPKAFLPLTPNTTDLVKKANEQSSVSSKSSTKSNTSMKRKNSFKSASSSFLNKITGKKSAPKPEETTVSIKSPPVSPAAPPRPPEKKEKKEWFDRDASECDYDKNPTDLFQALEARQFSYADTMFKQTNKQFNKECMTWVVARAQKKSKESGSTQLRFRALPLHAALVFGAPDDMVKKILMAYPRASRGRDVKGRLPIHLAYEHNASDDVVQMLLEAFPRGCLAKDKKDMAPLDYIGDTSDRATIKSTISCILSAKMEDERAKFDEEKTAAIAEQKIALQQDPVFLEGIVSTVTEDIEKTYTSKMELLERNYQKEIEMLKKKHDSETQALLEGFEVKLNFEKKLNRLKKGKA